MSDDGQGTPPTGLSRANLENKLAQLRDDIATVGAMLRTTRTDLSDARRAKDEALVATLTAEKEKLEAEKKELNDKIDATEAKLEALHQPLAPLAFELTPKLKMTPVELCVAARISPNIAVAPSHLAAMNTHFPVALGNALTAQDITMLRTVWESYCSIPHTSTKRRFATHDITLHDSFRGDTSGLFAATQGARMLVLKKLKGDERASYELLAEARARPPEETCASLVPFTIFAGSPAPSEGDAEAPGREAEEHVWASMRRYVADASHYGHNASDSVVTGVITAMMEALKFLHKRGVAHMDIKPANIFVRDDWAPQLGDFGSVRRLGARATSTTTAYVPQDMRRAEVHEYVASEQHDWWMLGMTAASMKTPRVGEGARDLTSEEVLGVLRGIGSVPAIALADKLVLYRP